MARDDERITEKLDEDQERLVAAAAPLGFELRQPRKRPLEDHKLTTFHMADTVLTRLTGEIDGALVDVFEYDWVQPGARGVVGRGRRILAVLRHPSFEGEVKCVPKTKMNIFAKAFIALALLFCIATIWWLLIPIWLWQYSRGQNPFPRNWNLGNGAFRDRFKVHGPSLEKARQALPPKALDVALAENLSGPIEVRPGTFAFSFDDKSLDAATLERTLKAAKRVVATYAPAANEAGTAYRIATDQDDALAAEEVEEERQRLPGSSA